MVVLRFDLIFSGPEHGGGDDEKVCGCGDLDESVIPWLSFPVSKALKSAYVDAQVHGWTEC